MPKDSPFVTSVRELEERLFAGQLDPKDSSRMHNDDEYSWLYRPSHHAESGLLEAEDIDMLKSGGRLLSIGSANCTLEQVIVELGVPAEQIVVADINPAILTSGGAMQKLVFDCTGVWPETGTFDLIIFPESLCIAIRDRIKNMPTLKSGGEFPNDAFEAELLGIILEQALARLNPDGEIRANGPMSHPNVVKTMSAKLREEGIPHTVDYARFFLRVRNGD